jgi:hypothetical protein
VANALAWQEKILDEAGRLEEAITVSREIFDRFGASRDPALRVRVATSLALLGYNLERRGRRSEAAEVYADVLRRYSAGEAAKIDAVLAYARERRRRRPSRRPLVLTAAALVLLLLARRLHR